MRLTVGAVSARFTWPGVVFFATVVLSLPASLRAQNPQFDDAPPTAVRQHPSDELTSFERRFVMQMGFVQMRPVGELAKHIGFGYGGEAAVLLRVDKAGIVALGADLGFAQYGSDGETKGILGLLDVRTTYQIWTAGLGMQLAAPAGPIRPYLAGAAGTVSFATQSNVAGFSLSDQEISPTTEHDDTGFAWLAGGGIYVPIHRGRTMISLDLGATYHAPVQKKSYLTPGSTQGLPNGSIAVTPVISEAKFVTWKIGVSVSR